MSRKLLSAALTALALLFSQGASSQNIKFAVLGPMAFAYGENQWAGAEMARDEINQAGGIAVGSARRQVEIIKIETNEIQSVADAASAIERAITGDKADFLVGGFRSEAVLAMQEVAMDNRKIFLGVGAASDKLGQNVMQNYQRYKYWFRVSPTKSSDLARSLFAALEFVAAQVRKDLGKETPRVAIVAEKAAWTDAMIKVAQDNLPKMGMEVAGLWQPSALATDMSSELAAIKSANADIVFTIISGPVGIALGRQMGEMRLPAIAFGINVEARKNGFWQATAGKGNLVATLHNYAEVELTPKTVAFMSAFKQRYKMAPIYTAATYDAIMSLKAAIETAGSLDADRLVPVIEKTEHVATFGVLAYDKRHDPVWAIGKTAGVAIQWQDGEKVPFWPPQIKGMKPLKLPPQ